MLVNKTKSPSRFQIFINPFVLAITLTFSIALIKGGATQWASLLWVGLTGISILLSSFFFETPARLRNLINHYFHSRSVQILAAFNIWCLFQYLSGISFDLASSFDHLLIGLGMMGLLTLWFFALVDSERLSQLFISIIAFATIQSLYGLWIYLGDINLLLWMQKQHYLDRPTGFFVNANHFAAYLVLSICLILSNVLANLIKTNTQPAKINPIFKLFDQFYSPQYLALGLLIFTLALTRSAGAIASLIVVLCLMSFHFALARKRLTRLFIAYSIGALVLFLILLGTDYDTLTNQIAELSHTISRRFELTKAAWEMLSEHWLLGVGGGSFYSHFSSYRSLEIGNSYYNYAHNDLLQFFIEYGIIGATLLFLFVFFSVRENVKTLTAKQSKMRITFSYVSIYGTVAVIIHSTVDFPLHLPGFAVLYLVIISANPILNSLHPIATKAQPDTRR